MKTSVWFCLVLVALTASAASSYRIASPGKTSPPDESGDRAEARIIWAGDGVSLRRKGQTDFRPVIKSTLFRAGDTLRVGGATNVTVYCADNKVCELPKGDYQKCCVDACALSIRIPVARSRTGQAPKPKRELPPNELATIEAAERAIARLRYSEAKKQFLLAHLYGAWKLTDLSQVLDRLSTAVEQPAVKADFGDLYLPLLRDLGDFRSVLGQFDVAERLYKKAVLQAADNPLEKADSHYALGRFYQTRGQLDKAIDNGQKADVLYHRMGLPSRGSETLFDRRDRIPASTKNSTGTVKPSVMERRP